MFEVFSFFADHLTLLHSLGALIGAGGIAAYLFVPMLAPFFAVGANVLSALLSNRLGVAALAGSIGIFVGSIYATHKADLACTARVTDLIAASQAAAKDRDAQIAAELEKKYSPVIANLQQQSDDLQRQVVAYANSNHGPACQLGAGALRLRAPR